MKPIFNAQWLKYSALAISLALPTGAIAGQKLNSDELSSLLIGNFMKIVYLYEGQGVAMWEYYQKDGTIAGSTDKWGDYSATYKINEKGEMCVTYASGDYNGCYSYERSSDNEYKLVGLTWPENTTLEVTIVPGLHSNITAN